MLPGGRWEHHYYGEQPTNRGTDRHFLNLHSLYFSLYLYFQIGLAGQIRLFINNVSSSTIWLGVNGQCQLNTIPPLIMGPDNAEIKAK